MALEIEEGTIKQTVYLQNCSGKANRTVLQVENSKVCLTHSQMLTRKVTGQVQSEQHYDRWLQQNFACGPQVFSLHYIACLLNFLQHVTLPVQRAGVD